MERRYFRNSDQIWAIRAVGIGNFFIGGLFAALSSGDATTSRLGIAIPFALIGAFTLWRPGRACLIAEAEGVTVRNVFKTVRIPWTSIRTFSLTSRGFYPRIAVVELQEGSQVPVWAIQGPKPWLRPRFTRAQVLVDELNELLTRVRHTTPSE